MKDKIHKHDPNKNKIFYSRSNQIDEEDEAYTNYYKGIKEFDFGNIESALSLLSKSFVLFKKLNNEDMIYKNGINLLSLLSIQRKTIDSFNNEIDLIQNFSLSDEIFRENDMISKKLRKIYLPSLLMDKIWFHRKRYEYNFAIKYAQERLDFIEKILTKNPNDLKYIDLKNSAIRMVFECKINVFRQRDENYSVLANLYLESARWAEYVDSEYAGSQWANYFYYIALKNKKNEEAFKKNIDLAIEWERKGQNNKKSIKFFEDIRFKRLEQFSRKDLQFKIESLEEKKVELFRSGQVRDAKKILVEIELLKANCAEQKSEFKIAKHYLSKTIKTLEKNNFISAKYKINELESKRLILEFKDAFSEKEYITSLEYLEKWLQKEKVRKSTKTYFTNQLYRICVEIIIIYNSKSLDKFDLESFIDLYHKSQERKIHNYKMSRIKELLDKCISKKNVKNNFDELVLLVTKWIAGSEIASELKRIAIIETSLKELTWIEKYPDYIQEKYQNICLIFNDLIPIPEFIESILFQMIKLIEKILEIVIECEAKYIWGRKWKEYSEEITKKEINKLTLGEYFTLYKRIYFERSKKDKTIEEIFILLENIIPFRNLLAHSFTQYTHIEAKKKFTQLTKLLYFLQYKFPICGVIEAKKGKEYHLKLIWNHFPNIFRIFITSKYELKIGTYYYFFPSNIFYYSKQRISPKTVFSAYFLYKQLELEYNDIDNLIVLSANDPTKLTKDLFNLFEKSDDNKQIIHIIQSFLISNQSSKLIAAALLRVYGESFKHYSNKEDIFSHPIKIFSRCVNIMENLYGKRGKSLILSLYKGSLNNFFKNLILGKKFARNIFPNKELIFLKREQIKDIITDFNSKFGEFNLKAPPIEEIIIWLIKGTLNKEGAIRVLSILDLQPYQINEKVGLLNKTSEWGIQNLKIGCKNERIFNTYASAIIYYSIFCSNQNNLSSLLKSSLIFSKKIAQDCSISYNFETNLIYFISKVIYDAISKKKLSSRIKF